MFGKTKLIASTDFHEEKKEPGNFFIIPFFLFRLRERKWTTERANGTNVYCVSVYHNWVMLILDKFYELLFIFTFHSTFCFTLDDSLIGNTSLCLMWLCYGSIVLLIPK